MLPLFGRVPKFQGCHILIPLITRNGSLATNILGGSSHGRPTPLSALSRLSREPTVRSSSASPSRIGAWRRIWLPKSTALGAVPRLLRSEEHTSELQSRQY